MAGGPETAPPIERRPDLLRNVLNAAILAASPSNSQPWRFEVEDGGLNVIHQHRASLLNDIDQHATLISFGGALENIAIAARGLGYTVDIRYFPETANPYFVAEVVFEKDDGVPPDPLFDAIRRRRTTRSAFARRPLDTASVDAIRSSVVAADSRLRLHIIDAPFAKRELSDLLIQAEKTL